MVSGVRFYPKGAMGVDQAALLLARSKYPQRWNFEEMAAQERDVWQGMNTTFDGAIIDIEHPLRTKALGDPNSLQRYCDFSEAVFELRQALHAGDLVAFFIDENGNQDFVRPNSWGSDDALIVIASGLADLDDGYRRLLLLREADLKKVFGTTIGKEGNPEPRPPSPAELERWYKRRVENHKNRGVIPSLKQDESDAKEEFPGVIRNMVRKARAKIAPANWGKRGPRGPRKSS